MATEVPETPQGPAASSGRFWTRQRAIVAAIVVVVLLIAGVAVASALTASRSTTAATSSPIPTSDGTSAIPTPSPTESATSAPPVDPSLPAQPVPIESPAAISPGLTARISLIEAVQGVGQIPGETSGPSIRVTVEIDNSTPAEASLATTVVTAYYGDAQTPASELTAPGGSPMPQSVPAGSTATGVYIFTIPDDQRSNVRIQVDYSVDVQPLVFQGAVPV